MFAHEFTEVFALDFAAQSRDYDSEDEDNDGPVLNFEAEEMFPSLGATTKSSASTASSGSKSSSGSGSWGSSSKAVSNLTLNFARAVSVQPPPPTASFFNDGGYGSTNLARRMPPLTSRPLYHKTAEAVSGGRWLTTGSHVTAQYKQLREEAYEFACARNKCFMQATRAYQR